MLTCCGCRASPPRTPYASPARTFHACRHGQRYCHELCRPLAEHSAPYEAPSGGALASKLTVTYIANVLRTVARCCRERGWGGGSAQVRHHAARVSFRLCMDRIVWIALYGVRGTLTPSAAISAPHNLWPFVRFLSQQLRLFGIPRTRPHMYSVSCTIGSAARLVCEYVDVQVYVTHLRSS